MTPPPDTDGPDENAPRDPAKTTPTAPDQQSSGIGSADVPSEDEPADASGETTTTDAPGEEASGAPGLGWAPPDATRTEDAGPAVTVRPGPGAAPDPAPPPPGPGIVPVGPPPPGGAPLGAPGVFGPQPPAGPRRTSRLAITALVTGLIGLVPFAIGFGIAALVQLRRRMHKGAGLAIGGFAASLAWIVAGVAVVVTMAVSTFTVERNEAGEITKGGRVQFSTLQEGDCYGGFGPDATALTLVDAVPCSEPHRGEVIKRLPLGTVLGYPHDETPREQAARECEVRAEYLRKSRLYTDLEPYVYVPEASSPDGKGQQLSCAIHYVGAETLDTRLAETVDPSMKPFGHLQVGECVESLERFGIGLRGRPGGYVAPVPCTEPHRYEVYANFDFPLDDLETPAYDPLPQKEVQKKAEKECDARADEMLKKAPPIDLEIAWLTPLEHTGFIYQTVVCFVGKWRGGDLEEPIVSD